MSNLISRVLPITVVALSLPGMASAQSSITSSPSATNGLNLEENLAEVVVTGTRLVNPNFSAPTPVTTISSEVIQQQAPTAIADVVNQVPAFRISNSANGGGRFAAQQFGVSATLDLRGLSPQRTLVLINGRRPGFTNQNGYFDTNMIPVSMIERTDVVTGGASAAYGSDAVAGVVNFVLKNHYEGISGNVQAGVTEVGDGIQYVGNFIGGTAFADGKGHVVLGIDYTKSRGVGFIYTRDWAKSEPGLVTVTAAQRASLGLPANYWTTGVEYANVTPWGLITTATSSGTRNAFTQAGAAYAYNYPATIFGSGASAVAAGSNSNYGWGPNSAFNLQPENTREAVLARADYDLTPNLNVFVEANFGHTALPEQTTNFTGFIQTFQVARTSLPTAVQSQYTAANVTVGRIFTENGGGAAAKQTDDTWRGLAGIQGTFLDGWKWDASWMSSRGRLDYWNAGMVTGALMKAVYGCATTGNPNLTASLLAQVNFYESYTGKSCVPFSPFGEITNAAARNYIFNDQLQKLSFDQDTFQANVSGSPAKLPAGDLSLAAGVEWRKSTLKSVTDALANYPGGVFTFGGFPAFGGSDTVKEAYVEVGVPVLANMKAVKSLDLNAAGRVTDYKVSGRVNTWKIGAVWQPVDGLRLRVSDSRDIRAPNAGELYFIGPLIPGATALPTQNIIVGSPGYLRSTPVDTRGVGSPILKPENANTVTAGFAYEGRDALDGIHLDADYFDINIKNAIVRPTGTQTQSICAGLIAAHGYSQTVCNSIGVFFNAAGDLTEIDSTSQNIGSFKTRGVDINVGYAFAEDAMHLPGRLTLSALATRAFSYQQTTPAGTVELAGSMNGLPKWSWRASANYEHGAFGTTLGVSGFSRQQYEANVLYSVNGQLVTAVDPADPGYVSTNANTYNINHFAAMVYTDLSLRYRFHEKWQIYGNVTNLLDRDPPPSAVVFGSGVGLNYDLLGRAYKLGIRFNN